MLASAIESPSKSTHFDESIIDVSTIEEGVQLIDLPSQQQTMTVQQRQQEDFYCEICSVIQQRGRNIHHCRDCGYCIEGMDHHCPWMVSEDKLYISIFSFIYFCIHF